MNHVFLNQKERRLCFFGIWVKQRKTEMGKGIMQSVRSVDRIKMEVRPVLLTITSKSVSRPLGFFK